MLDQEIDPMPRRPPLGPRKQPKQERARLTVEALVEATARVLVREGYDRVSTNRIAEVAGVNIGSLYQYFPNKGALISTLIDRHLAEVARAVQHSLSQPTGAPLSVELRAIIRAYLRAYWSNPKLYKALVEQIPRLDRFNPLMRFRRDTVGSVRDWLARHRSEIDVRDLEFAAFAIVHLVDALGDAAVLERPEYLADDTLVHGITEIVLRYLGFRHP